MAKEIVQVPKLPLSKVLSPATKVGNLVFVSGRTGRDNNTGLYPEGVKSQTRRILEDIGVVLEAAGSSMDQVLSNTCYLTNKDDFAGFNEVYLEFFPADRPARTTVEAGLMTPEALVEITAVACLTS